MRRRARQADAVKSLTRTRRPSSPRGEHSGQRLAEARQLRIIQVVLRDVVARVEGDQIQLLLHWQGGDHTRLTVTGQTRWTLETETVDLIRACARLMPDKDIAGLLNRIGKRSACA